MRRAFEQLALDVLSGAELLRELVPPAAEAIDPALDRVLVAADCLDREAGLPAVVPERLHRRLAPARFAGAAIEQRRGELVVAVREDVGADDHVFAHRPLDGESSRVHLRMQALDDDAPLQRGIESRPRSRDSLRRRRDRASIGRRAQAALPARRCLSFSRRLRHVSQSNQSRATCTCYVQRATCNVPRATCHVRRPRARARRTQHVARRTARGTSHVEHVAP